MSQHGPRIAFDIGGTFTDFVLKDPDRGVRRFWKTLSTPERPAEAVIRGIEQLIADADVDPTGIDGVLHATTVATNAILERRGSATALITTSGFRDVLILGRQKRHETFDLHQVKPSPLIRRRDILELDERVRHDGTVLRAPDRAAIDALLDAVAAGGYASLAVCLLHAYANPEHERLIASRCRERGLELSVSLSSDVSPRFREYERTSTVVANAYVKPIVERYLGELDAALRTQRIEPRLMVMQSNGGLVTPALAADVPIRIVESGPAAGVMMCRSVARSEGIENVLTFDMGGTTAKLGAIDGGEPATLSSFEVDQVGHRRGSGLPLNIAAIELIEIGAGGGSIARASLGAIAVGPRSAGSEPGPACYGRGGVDPTVTDANLVLGYLDAATFNGGAIRLDVDAARRVIADGIGAPLGLDVAKAAWGVHLMATASMERALRTVSVERGRDPRDYALVAFGGAGPIHAARLARDAGVRTVIVPEGAGVGSAVGLLDAPPKIDASTTRVLPVDAVSSGAVRALFAGLQDRLGRDLERFAGAGDARIARFATARYAGQGHEVRCAVPDLDLDDAVFAESFRGSFNAAYERAYRYRDDARAVEGVDWEIVATMPLPGAGSPPTRAAVPRSAPARSREVWFPETGGWTTCAVFDRDTLASGRSIDGPCVIEEPESTTLVLPGDRVHVSDHRSLMITIAEASR